MIKTRKQFEEEFRRVFTPEERNLILDEVRRNPQDYNLKGLRQAGGYQAILNAFFGNILIDIQSGLDNVKIRQKSGEFGMNI